MKNQNTYSLLLSLYITQYLPIAFFTAALPAIMMIEGAEMKDLTFIYLLGIVWALKFLWAPLIDRFSPGNFFAGHYRSWIIVLQTLLFLLIVYCAVSNVRNYQTALTVIMFVVCFIAATQDIASDALAVNLLDDNSRGLGNGIQSAGGMIGQMIGGGVVLMLYNKLGWSGSLLALAVMLIAPLLLVLIFKEPQHFTNPNTSNYKHMFGTLKDTRNIQALITNALLYSAVMVSFSFLIPSLVKSGWGAEKIGLAGNFLGPVLASLMAVLCGLLIKYKGLFSALLLVALLQIGVNLLSINLFATSAFWQFSIALLQLVAFGVTACFMFTSFMAICDKNSGGSVYSIFVCIATLTASILSAISVNVAQDVGIDNIRYITIAMTVIACLLFLRWGKTVT